MAGNEDARLRSLARSSGPAGEVDGADRLDRALEGLSSGVDFGVETLGMAFGPGRDVGLGREREALPGHLEISGRGHSGGADPEGFVVVFSGGGGEVDEGMLEEVGRGPDMVLMDWMGEEDGRLESPVLSEGVRGGLSDEEIDYAIRKSRGEELVPVVPEGMRNLGRDLSDYKKFGGDVVSMELDRAVPAGGVGVDETTSAEDDEVLSFMTDTGEPYDAVADVDEALGALREDLGSGVKAVLRNSSGGRVEFDVASPVYGDVQYVYDQSSGVGRMVGGR